MRVCAIRSKLANKYTLCVKRNAFASFYQVCCAIVSVSQKVESSTASHRHTVRRLRTRCIQTRRLKLYPSK